MITMNNIKVNEYIRTPDGKIQQIKEIWKNTIVTDNKCVYYIRWLDSNNIESYPKVIDLIKEDDFVNEQLITKVKKDPKDGSTYIVTIDNYVIRNEAIEEIVTRESFERETYRLGRRE